jgi:hypothetical protein
VNKDDREEIKKQIKESLIEESTKITAGAIDPYQYSWGQNTGDVWIDTNTTTPPYVVTPNITDGTVTSDWTFDTGTSNEQLAERIEAIEKRLGILDDSLESQEKREKYKALKEAYEHYKFLEKLCEGEESELGKESE